MGMSGTLYVVATPIGNLEDLTYRAARVLGEVALVVAEDTRQTRKLLTHLGLRKPLLSYNQHNAAQRTPQVPDAPSAGDVAPVSDAGPPPVSDPGAGRVRAAAEAVTTGVALPRPSAGVAALSSAVRTERWKCVPTPCWRRFCRAASTVTRATRSSAGARARIALRAMPRSRH